MGAMLSACLSVSFPVNFSVMCSCSFLDGSAAREQSGPHVCTGQWVAMAAG